MRTSYPSASGAARFILFLFLVASSFPAALVAQPTAPPVAADEGTKPTPQSEQPDTPVDDAGPLTGNDPTNANKGPPNLLWIVTDQQKWDSLGIVQRMLKDYEGKFHIQTPNLDRLAESGVLFKLAHCVSRWLQQSTTTCFAAIYSSFLTIALDSILTVDRFRRHVHPPEQRSGLAARCRERGLHATS